MAQPFRAFNRYLSKDLKYTNASVYTQWPPPKGSVWNHLLYDTQQEVVQLPLLVDVQKQVRIVQRNAAPHQVAARNLLVLLVKRPAALLAH